MSHGFVILFTFHPNGRVYYFIVWGHVFIHCLFQDIKRYKQTLMSIFNSCGSRHYVILSFFIMVGLSCRTRVLKHLKGQFTLSEAEEHYVVNYFQSAPPVQSNDERLLLLDEKTL